MGCIHASSRAADTAHSVRARTAAAPARAGRNPQTQAVVEIPVQTVPVFKAGKGLKDSVAG